MKRKHVHSCDSVLLLLSLLSHYAVAKECASLSWKVFPRKVLFLECMPHCTYIVTLYHYFLASVYWACLGMHGQAWASMGKHTTMFSCLTHSTVLHTWTMLETAIGTTLCIFKLLCKLLYYNMIITLMQLVDSVHIIIFKLVTQLGSTLAIPVSHYCVTIL